MSLKTLETMTLGLSLLSLALLGGTASAAPGNQNHCFQPKPIPTWLATDVGVLDDSGARPGNAAEIEMCAIAGEFSLGWQDDYHEVVRTQAGTFSFAMQLASLTDGAAAVTARTLFDNPDSAQMRIVARPGFSPNTAVLVTEVRQTSGTPAVTLGSAVVRLPVNLRVVKNGNVMSTQYSAVGSTGLLYWVTQASVAHYATDLGADAMTVGMGVAGEGGVKAVAEWNTSAL